MSDITDPGKDARRAARRQEEEIKRQRQKQSLEKAEAEEDLARKKALARSPAAGRRGLITGQTVKRETLG